jgi:iron complex transport system substrate-binding protein
MIRAAGGNNAMQGFSRYRPLSQEGVIASAPDLLLITRAGMKALGGSEGVWKLPGIALTPAGQHQRLLVVDDMALLGFGLETPQVLVLLRESMEQAQ